MLNWKLETKSLVASFISRLKSPSYKIKFVLSESNNYISVQEQLLSQIKRHIRKGSVVEVGRKDFTKDDESLSFGLFIRDPADVLMSHGVADKNYMFIKDKNTGNRLINSRRAVLVPGPWLKRRLLKSKSIKLGEDQIICVGWPRLDELKRLQKKWNAKYPTYNRENSKPNVLWAPTHDYSRRGADKVSTSSYPEFMEYTDLLGEKYNLEIALHPRNRKDKKPTVEKLLDADFVISDFGTMVYEAWALGKTVIFPDWIIKERILEFLPGSAEAKVYEDNIGLHANSIDEMVSMIDGGVAYGTDVQQFMEDYISPEYDGTSSIRIANVLKKLGPDG